MTKPGINTWSEAPSSATTSRQCEIYLKSRTSSKCDLDVPLLPGVGSGPVFVQVEILKPKDAFGLNTVNFDQREEHEKNSTLVSLVSNGAECVMLSKKMFMDHANEMVKHMIRRHVSPYPSEVALQDNLQAKVDWEIYKQRLVKDVVAYKRLSTVTQR
ncbi:hypothetical protein CAPTEDRAFT_196323 [Capitella teleta]|uniref:Uncharacterized protein n=1 Tax=Capitella teleta TaxID=283909 RepID=R7T4T1_CAPTE|nr:hypothetical protein CAPTEDRAFT_196323 [Capitella teleta]|eukprot:ELT87891.1 hypothetical protein CAPTEDRAFT_196323 [Capitella teleta]